MKRENETLRKLFGEKDLKIAILGDLEKREPTPGERLKICMWQMVRWPTPHLKMG
ncbi:MAG TPA: hypothetical protein GXX29_14535 [Firmicutes bacterium]|nr:hypothetical protein [Bacillota bacterium]